MSNTITDALERFKRSCGGLVYGVSLQYGEDIGCDDGDVPAGARTIRVVGTPVGVLGGARIAFVGSAKQFTSFDFNAEPIEVVSNPPPDDLFRRYDDQAPARWAIWGTPENIAYLTKKRKIRTAATA